MAKKDEGKGGVDPMSAKKGRRKKPRRGRQPGGPHWHEGRQQWVCRLAGKTHLAPRTIGPTKGLEARKWWLGLAAQLGVDVARDLPGSETEHGLRKMMLTITSETASELAELDPLVADEQLSATTNYSRSISVAIHEALFRRKTEKLIAEAKEKAIRDALGR